MTRRKLSPHEKAHREDVYLYGVHDRVIALTIDKHRADGWNTSDVVRAALEEYGKTHHGQDLELDQLTEAEERIEAFKLANDGKSPQEVKVERIAESERARVEQLAQERKREDAKLARAKMAYGYLKKKDIGASVTLDWFANWHKELVELGWTGTAFEVMHELIEKGDREGWDA